MHHEPEESTTVRQRLCNTTLANLDLATNKTSPGTIKLSDKKIIAWMMRQELVRKGFAIKFDFCKRVVLFSVFWVPFAVKSSYQMEKI